MSIWLHLEKESDSWEDSKHLLRLKENRHIAQWLCMCWLGVGVSLFFKLSNIPFIIMHHIPKAYEFAMKESSIATLISVHPVHLYGNFAETKWSNKWRKQYWSTKSVFWGGTEKYVTLQAQGKKKYKEQLLAFIFIKTIA